MLASQPARPWPRLTPGRSPTTSWQSVFSPGRGGARNRAQRSRVAIEQVHSPTGAGATRSDGQPSGAARSCGFATEPYGRFQTPRPGGAAASCRQDRALASTSASGRSQHAVPTNWRPEPARVAGPRSKWDALRSGGTTPIGEAMEGVALRRGAPAAFAELSDVAREPQLGHEIEQHRALSLARAGGQAEPRSSLKTPQQSTGGLSRADSGTGAS